METVQKNQLVYNVYNNAFPSTVSYAHPPLIITRIFFCDRKDIRNRLLAGFAPKVPVLTQTILFLNAENQVASRLGCIRKYSKK